MFIVFCHFLKCVLVHIRIKGEVDAVKPVNYFTDRSKAALMGLRLFIATLWLHAGKGLTSWLLFVVFLSLPMWYPRSGVVLDCIDS